MKNTIILFLMVLIMASCKQSPSDTIFNKNEKDWLMGNGLWYLVSKKDSVNQVRIKQIIADDIALRKELSKKVKAFTDSMAAKYPEAEITFTHSVKQPSLKDELVKAEVLSSFGVLMIVATLLLFVVLFLGKP